MEETETVVPEVISYDPSWLKAEALRSALSVHGTNGDSGTVLETAEKFYAFLKGE